MLELINGQSIGGVDDAKNIRYHDSNVESALDEVANELNKYASVEVSVNSSGVTTIPYPIGFDLTNIVLVGCTVISKYGVNVDYSYDTFNYFGNLVYRATEIEFTPKVNGNISSMRMIFKRL